MYNYADIQKSEDDFNQIMQEREMAVAYLAVTQAMGPSPQLLSFLNYDNSLGTELGVALESMSVEEQHTLISSKINLETFDKLALESLADRVRKIGKYMQTGGVVALVAGMIVSTRIGRLGLAAIIAGSIIRVVTTKMTKTFKFDAFTAMTRHFSEALKTDMMIANGIPNDFEEQSWVAFRTNVVDKLSNEYQSAYDKDDDVHKKNMTAFDDSGWSETRFSAATEWMMDNGKKVADLEKSYGKKIANIEKFLTGGKDISPAVMSSISASLGVSMKLFQSSATLLTEVKHVLENVSRNFEEKDSNTGQPNPDQNANPNPNGQVQTNNQQPVANVS